jgi:hypothetical protein
LAYGLKKRPSAYLFLSALLGTFFGIAMKCHPAFFIALSLIFLISLSLSKDAPRRIFYFLAFIIFICASAARFRCNIYDSNVDKILKSPNISQGLISKIHTRLDGTKQILVTLSPSKLRVLITLYDSAAAIKLSPGQFIRFKCSFKPLAKALSPVHFDAYRFGLAHTIHAQASIYEAKHLALSEHKAFVPIAQFREHLKHINVLLTPSKRFIARPYYRRHFFI